MDGEKIRDPGAKHKGILLDLITQTFGKHRKRPFYMSKLLDTDLSQAAPFVAVGDFA